MLFLSNYAAILLTVFELMCHISPVKTRCLPSLHISRWEKSYNDVSVDCSISCPTKWPPELAWKPRVAEDNPSAGRMKYLPISDETVRLRITGFTEQEARVYYCSSDTLVLPVTIYADGSLFYKERNSPFKRRRKREALASTNTLPGVTPPGVVTDINTDGNILSTTPPRVTPLDKLPELKDEPAATNGMVSELTTKQTTGESETKSDVVTKQIDSIKTELSNDTNLATVTETSKTAIVSSDGIDDSVNSNGTMAFSTQTTTLSKHATMENNKPDAFTNGNGQNYISQTNVASVTEHITKPGVDIPQTTNGDVVNSEEALTRQADAISEYNIPESLEADFNITIDPGMSSVTPLTNISESTDAGNATTTLDSAGQSSTRALPGTTSLNATEATPSTTIDSSGEITIEITEGQIEIPITETSASTSKERTATPNTETSVITTYTTPKKTTKYERPIAETTKETQSGASVSPSLQDSAFGRIGGITLAIAVGVAGLLLLLVMVLLSKLYCRPRQRGEIAGADKHMPRLQLMETHSSTSPGYGLESGASVADSHDYEQHVKASIQKHKQSTTPVTSDTTAGVSTFLLGKRARNMSNSNSPPCSPVEAKPLIRGDDDAVVFNFAKIPGEASGDRHGSIVDSTDRGRSNASTGKHRHGSQIPRDSYITDV